MSTITLTGTLDMTFATKDPDIRNAMNIAYFTDIPLDSTKYADYMLIRTLDTKSANARITNYFLAHGQRSFIDHLWPKLDKCNQWILLVLCPQHVTKNLLYFQPTRKMIEFSAQNWGIYMVHPNYSHYLRLSDVDRCRYNRVKKLDTIAMSSSCRKNHIDVRNEIDNMDTIALKSYNPVS